MGLRAGRRLHPVAPACGCLPPPPGRPLQRHLKRVEGGGRSLPLPIRRSPERCGSVVGFVRSGIAPAVTVAAVLAGAVMIAGVVGGLGALMLGRRAGGLVLVLLVLLVLVVRLGRARGALGVLVGAHLGVVPRGGLVLELRLARRARGVLVLGAEHAIG